MRPSLFEKPTEKLYYKGDHEIVSLQVLKAIAAFAVVFIHTRFYWRDTLIPFCRGAVPVFFMITGYFLLNREGVLSVDKIKKTVIKILKLNVIMQVLYILCLYFVFPNLMEYQYESPIKNVWTFLIFGDTYCPALWYLNAVIEALGVIYLALRFRLLRILPAIAFLGLLSNLILGDYAIFWHDIDVDLIWTRNFFTIGIPSIYIGMCIRRFEHKITWTAKQLIILAIIGCMFIYAEYAYVLNYEEWGDILIFTMPATIFTFLWALRSHALDRCTWLYNIGKNYSLYIYVLHWYFRLFFTNYPQYNVQDLGWLMVTVLTLLLSFVVRKIVVGIKSL